MSWSTEYENSAGSSGISEDPNDILVFGYGCKLFRDDEKAEWIDNEMHLIPWMGDSSLKIDRYDGRGALMDLKPFLQLPSELESSDPYAGMLPEDAELEKLLDEERYHDLREDSEFDDLNYQEVEFRKFQSDVNGVVGAGSYAAIGYSYDQSGIENNTPSHFPEAASLKTDEDLPYVKPPGLVIPSHIVLPTTIKLHAKIEKTAKFIASHGNQMEIILKTKQSGNALFNFLDYKDALNPYYKFLVEAIRNNVYTPMDDIPEQPPAKSPSHGDGSESEDDSNYLHPSLFRTNVADTTPSVSNITYKSSTGPTAYSLLVSKIKGSVAESTPPPEDYSQQQQQQQQQYPSGYQQVPSQSGDFVRPQNHVPTPNDQLVIEKMASYVVKNGDAFEELAKTKGDPRFVFLNPQHEFHWYYLNCKERFKAESSAVVASRNFVSYSDTPSSGSNINNSSTTTASKILEIKKKSVQNPVKITLQSIELPLSANGIPIANHASISSRPATIPPEVASRIELIKKKNNLFAKKDLLLNAAVSTVAPEPKKEKLKIQFASSIGKGMSLATESSGGLTLVDGEEFTNVSDSVSVDISKSGETKEVETSDIELSKNIENNTDNGTQSLKVPEDIEKDRKEWRRQKAALFLQRINSNHKSPEPTSIISKPSTEVLSTNSNDAGDNEVEVIECPSDVESIPESVHMEENDEQKENDNSEIEEIYPNTEIKISNTLEVVKDSKNGSSRSSRSSSRMKSRSRSPVRSSSFRRSLSDSSSDSFSDSSQIRRKRSKRKHSKKRRKKRNKERSSSGSRSKKSKKHRR